MIRLEDVHVRYAGSPEPTLAGVDLEVARGELVALLGESGSGKTTALKTINRLVEIDSGRVSVDGRSVAEREPTALRRGIGYAFQGVGLFPHRTVGENVATVPELLGWGAERRAARVEALLELVRLDPPTFRDRFPASLSGGQRQRVGLARALAAEPPVLLLDEPFGALDPVTREELQSELREVHDRLELATVLVTHDVLEALRVADRVAVLRHGRIVCCVPPRELALAPPHPYAAQLVESPRRQARRWRELLGDA